MKTNGQAYQDLFAYQITKKRDGTFLEIGSNEPIYCNNTFLLENEFNWRGVMVEYNSMFYDSYKRLRPNSIHMISDARSVNYRDILDNNNFPVNMDYLQIDLDVDNKSTLDVLLLLDNTVFDKYKFATITFEHDIYTGDYFNTREISRKLFADRGYVLLFPDVSVFYEGRYCEFEDWYVHPDLVDAKLIEKLKSDVQVNCDEIKVRLLNL
jgi:hypothetical protein